MFKKFYLKLLRTLMKKFYKSHLLKKIYGFLIKENLYFDDFALKNGVIEVMAIYKDNLPIKTSKEFVKTRFDNISNHYELAVKKANYQSGEMRFLLEKISENIKSRKNSLIILDLGCGTGLIGEALNINKDTDLLIGVDLSLKMLEICKSKNIYNELILNDIEKYLSSEKRQFDIIYACSVIQFFDETSLTSLFEKIKPRLNINGRFYFTFDIGIKESCKINSKLFCEHSIEFIEKLCSKYFTHFTINKLDFGRVEQGKTVDCGIVTIKKLKKELLR